ncbi:PilN domain-containing protein [Rubricoccus marinus]|uniref:Uncharacterized protein n=1 Tax=Rubricoccus marinus TaxID=716817 RepID=A0A259TUM2_9BACT|nr:PilN domain-containing protein [Rubricoccus marinus]OZC01274.1 hypothetical protein BSZ36_17660 [Rubricoccus marinus]
MTPPLAARPRVVGVHIEPTAVRWAELAHERGGVSIRRTVSVPIESGDVPAALRVAAGRSIPRLVYVHAPASALRLTVVDGPEPPLTPGWAEGVLGSQLPEGIDLGAFAVRAAPVRVSDTASRWYVAAIRNAAVDSLCDLFRTAGIPLAGVLPFGPDLDVVAPSNGAVAYAGSAEGVALVRDDSGTLAVEYYAGPSAPGDALREASRLGEPALVTGPNAPDTSRGLADSSPAFAASVALAILAASGGADSLNLLAPEIAHEGASAPVRDAALRRVLAIAALTFVVLAVSLALAPTPAEDVVTAPAPVAARAASSARLAPSLDRIGRAIPPGVWLRSLRLDPTSDDSVILTGVSLSPDGLSDVLSGLQRDARLLDARLTDASAQGQPGSPFRFEVSARFAP